MADSLRRLVQDLEAQDAGNPNPYMGELLGTYDNVEDHWSFNLGNALEPIPCPVCGFKDCDNPDCGGTR